MLASLNGHSDCVDKLLVDESSEVIDAKAKDSAGEHKSFSAFSALMLACRFGHASCVKRLREKDALPKVTADVNCADFHVKLAKDPFSVRCDALMIAARYGHSDCIFRLLENNDNKDSAHEIIICDSHNLVSSNCLLKYIITVIYNNSHMINIFCMVMLANNCIDDCLSIWSC